MVSGWDDNFFSENRTLICATAVFFPYFILEEGIFQNIPL